MTLTFDIHIGACNHLVNCIYQLWHHRLKEFLKNPFSPYKSMRDQIWPCRKISQDQSRVIIWINLVVLEHPMLYTKFQGHQPFQFWRRRFFKVFAIYGHGGHLGHVTGTSWTNFRSPIPWRFRMKFDFDWLRGFWEEDVWKCWLHTRTYIQTTEANLSIL